MNSLTQESFTSLSEVKNESIEISLKRCKRKNKQYCPQTLDKSP